jgi:NifU-like protein
MSYYSGRLREHFLNPRNVGNVEETEAVAESGSFTCGAILRISLSVEAQSQKITEAKFKATGCRYLISSASVMTEVVKGITTGEAARFAHNFEEAFTRHFGELPAERKHCAALSCEALLSAIARFSDAAREEWTGDEVLICTCFGVSEKTIERVIETNRLQTVSEVTRACNAGGGCHSCHPLIEEILQGYLKAEGW